MICPFEAFVGRVDGGTSARHRRDATPLAAPHAINHTRASRQGKSLTEDPVKDKQRWPVGVLYVTQITCGDKTKRTFANGQGVGVATVLRDPVVDAHPELRLYGTHSKRLVVRGSGFSPDGTSLTLEPTRAAKYSVIEATEWSVTLELKSDGSWCDELKDDKGVELKVTKVDSGAGEVIFDKPIIVATVVKEPDGDICDDSCEWALDGVCDDGTQPNIVDDEYGWDDDWGGRYGDDHYYAGFYDDYYGSQFDDEGSLPACAYGTDCTDCQPLHGDATKKEAEPVECDNTCAYARDGFCDDPRQGGECALGTDCQDCGPASKGNFSTYEDDTWWDDDESNWYWDDDYFADGDDERRHFEDWHDDEEKRRRRSGMSSPRTRLPSSPTRTRGRCYFISDGFTGYWRVTRVLRRRARGPRRPLCRAEGQRKSRLGAGVVRDDGAPGQEEGRRPHHAGRDLLGRDGLQDKKKALSPVTPTPDGFSG